MEHATGEPRFVHLTLSSEQREQVRAHTGRDSQALRLTMEELEERIVPVIPESRLAGNHSETLVAEELEERINPGIRLPNHNETMLDDAGC
jgi:hypothetical protein